MHKGEIETTPEESEELLKQFVALGYIDPPSENKGEQAIFADTECKYNHARNLSWCGHNAQAVEIFVELANKFPWESRFILQLAKCSLAAGYTQFAEKVVLAGFDPQTTQQAAIRLLWIDILLSQRKIDEAYNACLAMETQESSLPDYYVQLGNYLLRMRKWDDAARLHGKAIEIHTESAEGFLGLSTAMLQTGNNQLAADYALKAVALTYQLPRAHLNLGIALARSDDADGAIQALQMSLRLNPGMKNAHRYLAYIYATIKNDPARAIAHRLEYTHINELGLRRLGEGADLSGKMFPLPEFPSEAEREQITVEKRPMGRGNVKKSGKCFTLVSGLPRSGTSLMMQMLRAGGLEPKTDGERGADVDNPEGYFEWEAIKQVSRHPELMDEEGLDRKVIKAVSMLLPQMPYQHEYKIIFMTRPVSEVVASQAAMIDRLNTEGANIDSAEIQKALQEHRDSAIEWLSKHPRAKFIEIDYRSLIKDSAPAIKRIAEFLGPELLPYPERMATAIRPDLYRKRKS